MDTALKKQLLFIILVLGYLAPICSGVTLISDVNYQTINGGIIVFGQDMTVRLLDQVGNLTRFSAIVWNGNEREFLSVDAPTGTTVNFTSLQQTVLIYNVTDAGMGTQSIDYQGLGRPSHVDGGTFVMDGDTVIVTTNGNVLVTITWGNALANQLFLMLMIFMLIPILLAANGVKRVLERPLDADVLPNLIFGVVVVVIVMFVVSLIINNMVVLLRL